MRVGQKYIFKNRTDYYAIIIDFTDVFVKYFCSICQENETTVLQTFLLSWESEEQNEEEEML